MANTSHFPQKPKQIYKTEPDDNSATPLHNIMFAHFANTYTHTYAEVAKIWPGPLLSMYHIPAVNTNASATGSPGVVKFGRVLRKRRSHPFREGLGMSGCCPISIIAITP